MLLVVVIAALVYIPQIFDSPVPETDVIDHAVVLPDTTIVQVDSVNTDTLLTSQPLPDTGFTITPDTALVALDTVVPDTQFMVIPEDTFQTIVEYIEIEIPDTLDREVDTIAIVESEPTQMDTPVAEVQPIIDTMIEPDPGILTEEHEPVLTIDTIPIQWSPLDTVEIRDDVPDTILVEITDPDTLLILGEYALAAEKWKMEKEPYMDHFTIVLMTACSRATIDTVLSILPNREDMYLLPRDIDSRSCYIVCWGDFETRDEAENRFSNIPSWFAENGVVPMVRPLFKIDRLTRLSLTRLIIEKDHIKRE